MVDGKAVEEGLIALLEALEVDEAVDGESEAAEVEERALELHVDGLHDGRQQAAQTEGVALGSRERGALVERRAVEDQRVLVERLPVVRPAASKEEK